MSSNNFIIYGAEDEPGVFENENDSEFASQMINEIKAFPQGTDFDS